MALSRHALHLRPRWFDVWDRRLWLRVSVIAGVLGLTAYAASRPEPQITLLVLLLGVAASLPLVRWPGVGLAALIVSAVLVPFGIGTGTQTSVNVAVLLVGLLTVAWIVERLLSRDLRLLPSRALRPLLALVAASLVAFLNGLQPWTVFAELAPVGAQVGGLMIFVLSVCAFVVFAHRVREVAALRRLTWLFLVVAALCTLNRVGWLPAPRLDQLYATVANESLFWLWMVGLAFSQGVFNRRLGWPWRLGLIALVGAYMVFAIGRNRNWTSGWAPELVAMAAILWVGSVRAGIGASLVALVLLLPKLTDIANALFYSNAKNQYDIVTRTAAWSILGQIIKLNPIIGIGFANYYHYTPLYPILGYAVKFNSHNNYIDVVAQTGIVGLACLAWFFGELLGLAWGLRRRVEAGFPRAYVYGILGCVPATLFAAFLGDWLLPFVYNIGLAGFRASVLAWLFMAGLLVLETQATAADPGTPDGRRA